MGRGVEGVNDAASEPRELCRRTDSRAGNVPWFSEVNETGEGDDGEIQLSVLVPGSGVMMMLEKARGRVGGVEGILAREVRDSERSLLLASIDRLQPSV
jgi:hypothetical protein